MRTIGFRHRVKKTAEGEARPTQGYILEEDRFFDLKDDNSELDWVRRTYPVKHRPVEPDEDLSSFPSRHVQWQTVRKGKDVSNINPAHLRINKKGKQQVATKVPCAYDGLRKGDVYAMSLGGSGDRFAFALSKMGDRKGATVLRIPPSVLDDRRGKEGKDQDPKLLAQLAKEEPNLFHTVTTYARDIILVHECQSRRMDAMKARIACEQRLK